MSRLFYESIWRYFYNSGNEADAFTRLMIFTLATSITAIVAALPSRRAAVDSYIVDEITCHEIFFRGDDFAYAALF